MRRLLLFILFLVLIVALVYKSPFSALYNYNKARALYDNGQYEQSLPYFERSLFANSKGVLARFFYVLALSKSEPKYSVQKKLYEMSNSKIDDEATKTAKYQIKVVKHKLMKGLEDNYIYNAVYGNDILRWDIKSFPLKVYFDKSDTVPEYYINSINRAMSLWSKNTNFVKFVNVEDSSNADIFITFKNIEQAQCEDSCKFVIAYTEPSITSKNLLNRMTLTFYRTNPNNESFSASEIYNTAVHEIGHTLGVMGHSDNPDDLMYSLQTDNSWFGSFREILSVRDLNTLVLLYRISPTISNVSGLKSETFYYSPLILGDNDIVLQNKLEELKGYISSYPNIAAGYINISSIYADLGDFNSSLDALNQAEVLAKNDDERFLVAYNRAITYFNLQNYSKALEYAKEAKGIKSTQTVQELITDIELVLK